MYDDEYELTPHGQLEELKKEVEILKRNPLGKTSSSKDLLESVENLNSSINKLTDIFRTAVHDMKSEEVEEVKTEKEELSEKLDSLLEQNRMIAESIVDVAAVLKKQQELNSAPVMNQNTKPQRMQAPPMEQDMMSSQDFSAGPIDGSMDDMPPPIGGPYQQSRGPMDMPPPPPGLDMPPPPQKGFFNKFSK